MRSLILILLLTFFHTVSKGQLICGSPWPAENLQPDTITKYLFLNNSILVSKVDNTQPESNFSFKTKDFYLMWMPVYQTDIEAFVSKSMKGIKDAVISDTLQIILLDYEYSVILLEFKKDYAFIMYRKTFGEQDLFYGMVYKKRKLKSTLRFLSMNLNNNKY